MKELVTFIAQTLVEHPDDVKVREVRTERTVMIELTVNPEEKGKVIGRDGKIARAIRALVSMSATREGKRGILEIL
ncbi:MAG TPA: KH domain-containing protein [Chloroflexia bacterium]|nr:KH domain-containing protein [Chloroflexia bacterium]